MSPRTSTRERTGSGSWARASSSTAIWSAASLAFAFPGRSSPASGSPDPPAPWSTKASIGWNPNPRLKFGVACSFSECAPIRVASRSTTTRRSSAASSAKGERCDHTRARACARAARIAAIASAGCSASASIRRLTVGSEATGPNSSGWARTTPMSARQSPPKAIATARSSTVLPGSCTERVVRHGANPSERAFASPLTRAVDNSIAAPAEEISDSPPHSTRTPEPAGITFTYGVPFRLASLDLRQAQESLAGQALPCVTRRTQPRPRERSRLGMSGKARFPFRTRPGQWTLADIPR